MKLKGIINKLPICLTVLIILSMLVMPFNIVNADDSAQTYYPLNTGEHIYICNDSGYYYYVYIVSGTDVRYTIQKDSNTRADFYLISTSSFSYKRVSSQDGSFPEDRLQYYSTLNGSSFTSGGITYYEGSNSYSSSSIINSETNAIPYNSGNPRGQALLYSFGNNAVGPEPPAPSIQAGILTFNYYTDFASTQQNNVDALKSNRDTITWDYDTTDSNIPGIDLKVDIRAVPTKYYSSTEDGLDSLTWGDLSLDVSYSADLGSYQMNWNNRKVSFTWEEVVDSIKYDSNLPDYYDQMVNFWNFKKRFAGDYWYWTGWVYQIRLNTYSGDYTGEWQTIYQISSAPPEGSSETINYYVTGTGLTEPVYQTIQHVNNQNNITNNTWYVNGNPFDVNDTEGDNWLTKLLELILDAVFGTLGKLIDAITDLLIVSLEAIIDFFKTIWDRFLNMFDVINFTNDNQEYDLDIPSDESFLDIIPAFIRGMSSAGISYMIWIPLVVGIIFMVL